MNFRTSAPNKWGGLQPVFVQAGHKFVPAVLQGNAVRLV